MKDEHGFTPDDRQFADVAKEKLKTIIAAAKARREAVPVEESPALVEKRARLQAEYHPPVPVAAPVIDVNDGTWITQRTPVLDILVEDDGPNRPQIRRELITSRYTVTYRKRTAEDGDAEFELLPAPYSPLPENPLMKDAPLKLNDLSDSGRRQVYRFSKFTAQKATPQPTWAERNGGFSGWHRNA